MDKVKRKLQEQYLALRLERNTSKAWILENYLNTINLGAGNDSVSIYWVKVDTSGTLLKGDVNNDGVVNANDALMVMRYALGLITSLPNLAAADVDGNGTINANDALKIMRYALGLISSL